jgi:hypothetical protein
LVAGGGGGGGGFGFPEPDLLQSARAKVLSVIRKKFVQIRDILFFIIT